jgi:hypothetical protein
MRWSLVLVLSLAFIRLCAQSTTFTGGTNWNGGTWSNGTPNPGGTGWTATIAANVTVNCNCTVGNLTLNSSRTLTISSGQTLTIGSSSVNGVLTTNLSSTITVNAGGTLVIYGNLNDVGGSVTIVNNGTVTVYGNFTLQNGGNVSGSGTFTVTGTTSVGNSQLQNGPTFIAQGGCSQTGNQFCNQSNAVTAGSVCNYSFRKRIQIFASKVAGGVNLVNFPVLINIASDNDLRTTGNGGQMQNANGYDTYFTAADGTTPLSFQIQNYTATSGKYLAWVNIPSLSATADTFIYLYYGRTGVTADPSTRATWNPAYNAVWHLEETPNNTANQIADATSNNSVNSGTSFNTPTPNTSGIVGNAITFNGTSQYIRSGSTLTMPTINAGVMSMSAWGYYTSNPSGNQNLIALTNSTSPPGGGPSGARQLGFRGKPIEWEWGGGGLVSNATFPSVNNWHFYAYTWDGTTHKLYIDGVLASSATTASTQTGTVYWAGIGDYINGGSAGGERFAGSIDEVRVLTTTLTAGWIQTEYNNISSPSTFYSISSQPARWIGGTSTNWGTASNWSPASVPANGSDIIITNGTNQPTLDANRSYGGVRINTGATLNNGSVTMTVANDISNCGTLTGSTGTVLFQGTAQQNQQIGGTGTYNFNNLTINNTFATSPSVVVGTPVSISGTLTLTNGLLTTTSTNIPTLGASSSASSGSSASYVNGPLAKTGNSNFVFPVGKGGLWRRLGLSSISASTTFNVEYFNTVSSNNPATVQSPLTRASSLEYWQVNQTGSAANAAVTLYWENANVSGINDCTNLAVGRWSGSQWVQVANSAISGAPTACTGTNAGSVVSSAVVNSANFNQPFTFASISASLNPLPVTLVSFYAQHLGADQTVLHWVTATEKNNDYFTVLRSDDGREFYKLSNVTGAGTTNERRNYAFTDTKPLAGITYYKLIQTDFDGMQNFSPVISVQPNEEVSFSVLIAPNPTEGNVFASVLGDQAGNPVRAEIFQSNGQLVHSMDGVIEVSEEKLGFYLKTETLPDGLYILRIQSEKGMAYQKLIKR